MIEVRRKLVLVSALAAGAALTLPGSATATAPPPPPKPPAAATGYAAQVTTSSAVLTVRVNPRGLASEYYVQYGPTTAYGFQTTPATAGNGTIEVRLTQPVTGLQPGTLYHFRVVATSSAGATAGQDAVFTTRSIPLTMTIAANPDPVTFGEPLSVFGTLSGTGNAGAMVVLQANPFPYTQGFNNITAPQTTNAAGNFLFAVPRLTQSATLRVTLVTNPNVHSHGVVEHVGVSVTLHVRPTSRRGWVRFYGVVAPRQAHAPVVIERLKRGRRGPEYVTVGRTKLEHAPYDLSRFSRLVYVRPGRSGTYRAQVRAYGSQVSGLSRSILVR
jgi:hypothetical protein